MADPGVHRTSTPRVLVFSPSGVRASIAMETVDMSAPMHVLISPGPTQDEAIAFLESVIETIRSTKVVTNLNSEYTGSD